MSEEDEEQEGEAVERLRSEMGEKFETEMNNLQMIQVMAFPSPPQKYRLSHPFATTNNTGYGRPFIIA